MHANNETGTLQPIADISDVTRARGVLLNLKELRPGTVRILFVFDPWRSAILLVAGDKAGQWNAWYEQAIPLAEQRYEIYLKERTQQEGGQQ